MSSKQEDRQAPLKVAFIHPDLGIGGAERLVVDAAVGLKQRGHEVIMYTSHHDKNHCFEETRDGTLEVRVKGNTIIPRTLFGRFYILCAILRQFHLCLSLLREHKDSYDVLFVDQLSACIPLLKLFCPSKVFFYCHFPDKKLARHDTWLQKVYRAPVDLFEEWTTGMADTIVVNSNFTAGVFKRSFPSILKRPRTLYPPINFEAYDKDVDINDQSVKILVSDKKLIVSINRFERKKDIALAVHAFAKLKDDSEISADSFSEMRLIVGGGYDPRVPENVEYKEELDILATKTYGLKTFTLMPKSINAIPEDTQVVFLCSFNDAQRSYLLSHAKIVLYTPSNEHFGITPVEAMYARAPVIAANNGGPMESILHEKTGFLLPPTPEDWRDGIKAIMSERVDGIKMGQEGRKRAQEKFSLTAFVDQLEDILDELASGGRPTKYYYDNVEYGVRIAVAIVFVGLWLKYYWF
ncbi:Alpha-1,3-mannosyltransferase-like protein [Umbelopsis sp. WA50703]